VSAPRIVYHCFPPQGAQGGVKMVIRHVETLRELGFNAVCQIGPRNRPPDWLEHAAPVLAAEPVRPDDIVVLPEDATEALRSVAGLPLRKVVFCQSQLFLAMRSLDTLDAFPPHDRPVIMAVGPQEAATVRRLLPEWTVEVVPCFADERRFRPGEKARAILFDPKKRQIEPRFIQPVFQRLHPHEADRPWRRLEGLTETEAAAAFAASDLYLSLPRFESVGLASLEAMASGCVCAGFTGIGGRDYATADNGFWVPDDDLEAAVDALARAADLVRTGGPALAAMLEAGRETAAQWSYARFRAALEAFWMRHAPDARVRDGPLPPA
jgi:hypothetical protein